MNNLKIYLQSLGCDKNLVDSEMMLGILSKEGFEITDDENEADIAVINTCSFIHDAKQESVNAILEMADLKEEGSLKVLLVCGCLAQRYSDELLEEIPQIDAILGTMAVDRIAEAVHEVLTARGLADGPVEGGESEGGTSAGNTFEDSKVMDNASDGRAEIEKPVILPDIDSPLPAYQKRFLTGAGHTAYLKIAEGCDKHCTYCAIPSMRGKYRSYPMEDLLEDAKSFAEAGVRELILVAQESTLYGVDLYKKKMLPELLHKLCGIDGIEWIRILYCYPEEITDELIETIATEKKICHYLDVPIQHASDTILKRMGRRTSNAELREMIAKLRDRIPDICIRTTLITGFPGESDEDFAILKAFVDEMEFDRLGVFTYSQEEGTPAAGMPNQVDEEIKEARRDELMLLQQEISYALAEDMIGETLTAFVEGKLPDEDVYVARTYMDAPDVDGYFFISCDYELNSGDLVSAKVTDCNEYDLIGAVVNEPCE
jgi:ribosomal protein S12 methylthiotransferase